MVFRRGKIYSGGWPFSLSASREEAEPSLSPLNTTLLPQLRSSQPRPWLTASPLCDTGFLMIQSRGSSKDPFFDFLSDQQAYTQPSPSLVSIPADEVSLVRSCFNNKDLKRKRMLFAFH
jgi:hypothetical protein